MAGPSRPPTDLRRTIGFWGATAVMLGIIIGSGIFRTPAQIAGQLGHPWAILGLWALGGLVSLAGALTYAELASMRPESGGVYVFLRDGYGRAGRCMAFVFGWTYLLLSKPLAAAGIAVVLGDHVNSLAEPLWDRIGLTPDPRGVTTAVLVLLTWVNVRGVALGTRVAGVLTTLKVAALLLIVATAAALGRGSAENFDPGPAPVSPWWLAIAPVMAAILWTYDGWSDVGSLAGEVRNPSRTLAPAYIAGTVLITLIYIAVNAAYIAVVPLDEMRATDTVAPLVIDRLVGPAGEVAVTAVVVISTLGSTHGSIMTGARISYAQAKDGLLFGVLGRVHPRFVTPHVSLWGQLALSVAAVWAAQFEQLVGGFVFTMWIFYGLAGAAIFTLRVRRPGDPRPFRCPGYPVVPALFVLASATMVVLMIASDLSTFREQGWAVPPTMVWVAVLLAGVPIYFAWRGLARAAARRGGAPAGGGGR